MEELRPEVGAVSPDLVKVGDRGSNSGFSNPSLLSLILDLAFFLGEGEGNFVSGPWVP